MYFTTGVTVSDCLNLHSLHKNRWKQPFWHAVTFTVVFCELFLPFLLCVFVIHDTKFWNLITNNILCLFAKCHVFSGSFFFLISNFQVQQKNVCISNLAPQWSDWMSRQTKLYRYLTVLLNLKLLLACRLRQKLGTVLWHFMASRVLLIFRWSVPWRDKHNWSQIAHYLKMWHINHSYQFS